MNALTAEWVAKAEGDWDAAHVLYHARRAANPEAVCFHAQQCAEKYLKARPEEARLAVPQTHNLVTLLRLVEAAEPAWAVLEPDLRALGACAVAVRYPGVAATRADAREATKCCSRVRAAVRLSLDLGP